MPSAPPHDHALERLIERIYQPRLIENSYRGAYVECLIEIALGEPWTLTRSWASWDLEHPTSGARIEIKSSARLQTWTAHAPPQAARPPQFDIPPHAGYYANGDADWVDTAPIRHADLYIFAWHDQADPDTADHHNPDQWQFFVVPEPQLPPGQKSIGLNPLRKLAAPCAYDQLSASVDQAVASLNRLKRKT